MRKTITINVKELIVCVLIFGFLGFIILAISKGCQYQKEVKDYYNDLNIPILKIVEYNTNNALALVNINNEETLVNLNLEYATFTNEEEGNIKMTYNTCGDTNNYNDIKYIKRNINNPNKECFDILIDIPKSMMPDIFER